VSSSGCDPNRTSVARRKRRVVYCCLVVRPHLVANAIVGRRGAHQRLCRDRCIRPISGACINGNPQPIRPRCAELAAASTGRHDCHRLANQNLKPVESCWYSVARVSTLRLGLRRRGHANAIVIGRNEMNIRIVCGFSILAACALSTQALATSDIASPPNAKATAAAVLLAPGVTARSALTLRTAQLEVRSAPDSGAKRLQRGLSRAMRTLLFEGDRSSPRHYGCLAGPICGARTGLATPKKTTTPWPPQRVESASLGLE
jgi:hypothetical protein